MRPPRHRRIAAPARAMLKQRRLPSARTRNGRAASPAPMGAAPSRVSATTSRRTAIIRSLMLWPGSPIWRDSAEANGELRPAPSSATAPGAVEKAMKEPRVESNCVSPGSGTAARLADFTFFTNGLLRQASRNTRLVFVCCSMMSSTSSIGTVSSVSFTWVLEPGVDRHDQVAPVDLQAVAGIEEQPDVGAGERIGKLADLALQLALAEVSPSITSKPSWRSLAAMSARRSPDWRACRPPHRCRCRSPVQHGAPAGRRRATASCHRAIARRTTLPMGQEYNAGNAGKSKTIGRGVVNERDVPFPAFGKACSPAEAQLWNN